MNSVQQHLGGDFYLQKPNHTAILWVCSAETHCVEQAGLELVAILRQPPQQLGFHVCTTTHGFFSSRFIVFLSVFCLYKCTRTTGVLLEIRRKAPDPLNWIVVRH